jgi:hypothetical protein
MSEIAASVSPADEEDISLAGDQVPSTTAGLRKMLRYTPHHVALGVLWLALGISEAVQHSLWSAFSKSDASFQLIVDVGLLVLGALYIGIAVNGVKKAFIFLSEKIAD